MPVINSTSSPEDRKLIGQIELWANKNQEGYSVWVSVPKERGETATKITLLQVISLRNQKMVKNRSTLVDLDEKQAQEIIDLLLSYSISPQQELSTKEARYRLIIIQDKKALEILRPFYKTDWQEQKTIIKTAVEIEKVKRSGKTIYANCQLRANLGPHSLSCPLITSSSSIVWRSQERYLDCTCPYCGLQVKAKIKGGKIHCPACLRSADYLC